MLRLVILILRFPLGLRLLLLRLLLRTRLLLRRGLDRARLLDLRLGLGLRLSLRRRGRHGMRLRGRRLSGHGLRMRLRLRNLRLSRLRQGVLLGLSSDARCGDRLRLLLRMLLLGRRLRQVAAIGDDGRRMIARARAGAA